MFNRQQFCIQGHDTFIVGRYKNSYGCKECIRNRNQYKGNSEKAREANWKKHKIINLDGSLFMYVDFDRLYQIQSGRCKICGKHQSELKSSLSADHDHATGIIRGLLCRTCNLYLSIVENTEFNLKANEYLL